MTPNVATSEALDFRAECDQIRGLLEGCNADIFKQETLFKSWTVGDIIGHLHLWNIAADLALSSPDEFMSFLATVMGRMGDGIDHLTLQTEYFSDLRGAKLFEAWAEYYPKMSERFHAADPDKRVKWVGPDMSVRSSIIARQMEHWAHAQAIFDVLGVERENFDRLKNVAHIGVTTFSWSFRVRGQRPPSPKPFVRLTAPSGDIWTWNDPQDDNRIEGPATAFAQVVTQCRNVADTALVMTGPTAKTWMNNAQCFAGGPETPPAPGTRRAAAK